MTPMTRGSFLTRVLGALGASALIPTTVQAAAPAGLIPVNVAGHQVWMSIDELCRVYPQRQSPYGMV